MTVTAKSPRKRLTRAESKAQTRATLITVGRQHFLRYGLGGAVAEKIAEDAGYSRGALYSNFEDKEDLFIAVLREDMVSRRNIFRSILESGLSSKVRLRQMRDVISDMFTNRDWIVLRTEFEAGALRSERMRKLFVAMHRHEMDEAEEIVGGFLRSSEVALGLQPNEFVMVMINFAHGLAVTQKILGAGLSRKNTRNLVEVLFDHLVSAT